MGAKAESRIDYIDIAKALGIMLVIAGHVVSSNTEIKRVLYAFHMPLFFMLSGMLLRVKSAYSADTWKTLIIKKLRALMLPYIIWALIYSSFSFKHVALAMYGTRETLIMAGSLTSLWFLPVMFLASMLAELVLLVSTKVRKNETLAVVVGMAVCFWIGFIFPHHGTYGDLWGMDIAFIATAFMLLGMLVCQEIGLIPKTIWKFAIAVGACVVFVITVRLSSSSVGYVLMANADYGNPVVFFINAVAGSVLVIMISCLIAVLMHRTRVLSWIGVRTLGIFVVHKPIIELGRTVVTKMGLSFDNPMMVVGITMVTLAVSCVIVAVIEKVIPEIIGLKKYE